MLESEFKYKFYNIKANNQKHYSDFLNYISLISLKKAKQKHHSKKTLVNSIRETQKRPDGLIDSFDTSLQWCHLLFDKKDVQI